MLHRAFYALFIVAAFAWCLDSASAQSGSDGTVSAAGTSRLQAKPDKLRMQAEIRCYGSTAAAALKNLKAARNAATAQLKRLNADAASVCFSAPRVGMPQAVVATPIQGYAIPSPSYSPGPTVAPMDTPVETPAPGTAVPLTPAPSLPAPPAAGPATSADLVPIQAVVEPVQFQPPVAAPVAKPRPSLLVASATLKAEWSLQGADADAVVAAAETIRKKVLAADLSGSKAARDRLSPEEQELAEETESRIPRPVDPSMPPSSPFDVKPVPMFVYVAVLPDKQRKAMLADACAAAKRNAAELADAAGMRLGPIASLQGGFSNSFLVGRNFGQDSTSSLMTSCNDRETVAAAPDGIEFVCEVHANYRLLPAGQAGP
jgi:hypothetical protein